MYTQQITQFLDQLINALFPIRTGTSEAEMFEANFKGELKHILSSSYLPVTDPQTIVESFFSSIDQIKKKLDLDLEAIFSGDPAAKSKIEIILTYPGFYAIAVYRIAHLLHDLGVELIPRILTEHAHRQTGIDIHPAASIGHSFCIDHGTGVVIGETAEIGNRVKIYQGVTIGALSTDQSQRNTKRHPTIEDNVIIYAQATILGGKTRIGQNSVIGGNTWTTRSVPANSKIIYKNHSDKQLYQLIKN
ncbi:serine O-acetyltransferase EpsC [Parvicella tangerina]|uniref:Serine acetyltransferase n=1 Tax=Parvicella tangerina TaxID=2829795 RepID=A0A916NAU5_9FLAO|nr:serine O-acetyltransferase EpsC [Parvicella tangerina]CAG5081457.1 hypothetical protein CRYO30217_01638 [Parvicella tangerina]